MNRRCVMRAVGAGLLCAGATASCGDDVTGPGPAARIVFRAQPASAVAGAAIAPVQVEIRDASDRLVGDGVSVTVTLLADSAGATLEGTTSVSSADGVATFSNLSIRKAGQGYRLVATSATLPEAESATFAVTAALPSALTFSSEPQSAGLMWPALSPAIDVAVEDAFGNRVHTPVSVTVALGSNAAGAVLHGTMSAITTAGIATFDNLRVDRAGSGYTLRASAASVTEATSAPFGTRLGTLSVGDFYACGLTMTGEAYCWGFNNAGQLGDGTQTNRPVPVRAAAPLTFESITAGRFHSCGLVAGGQAYCWGLNNSGQTGDGTTTSPRLAPVAVTGGHAFTMLAIAQTHTCGLRADGVVLCWGSDFAGGLGRGVAQSSTPAPVAGGHQFVSVSAGFTHTCALSNTGQAFCWGNNSSETAALGDGTTTHRDVPTAVTGGLLFTRLNAGSLGTCGNTAAGETYCWGFNEDGRVGDGTNESPRTAPARVVTSRRYVDVHTGSPACAMTEQGRLECWGDNAEGGFGNGTTAGSSSPVTGAGGMRFAAFGMGVHLGCGLTVEGQVHCWGRNNFGQVGDGTTIGRTAPAPLSGSLVFARRDTRDEPRGLVIGPQRGYVQAVGP